jgi:hypothetical protein
VIPAETLSLITTFGCDATCAHCSVFSGPKRKDRMDPALVRSLIEQAARQPAIRMIAYTGGEPTLDFDLLLEYMAYAKSFGLAAGLVSNSNWALTPAIAAERFRAMIDRGLTTYITSLDEYHIEFVAIEHIRHAVHASLEFGVDTHINALWTPAFEGALSNLPETLGLPADVIDAHGAKGLHVWLNRPSRVRKVRDAVPRGPLPIIDERVAGPCDHINRHPIVAANGNVHMCCGVADSSPEGPAGFSAIGNAHTEPLADLLDRGQHDLYFNLLGRVGPYGVYRMVRNTAALPIPEGDEFTNACEVCARMQKPDLRPSLIKLLQSLKAGEIPAETPK